MYKVLVALMVILNTEITESNSFRKLLRRQNHLDIVVVEREPYGQK